MTARGDSPTIIFLMGPTGAGKTALAVELVERLPCEIVSVDSAMVYRGMDIGTAKPGPEILTRAPHRLIDILDPPESYSAARFREDALKEIDAIFAAGRIPLLVGGTGLYFRALQAGLADMPSAAPEVRARLAEELRSLGLAALHARLAQVDPISAARIHPNDPQRTLRALEVYEASGTPLSRLIEQAPPQALPYRVAKLVIAPADRAVLHDRIARRFDIMIERGLIDEVAQIMSRWSLGAGAPSLRLVGYRDVVRYLEGRVDRETMRERAIIATRQLAKRQLTWCRGEADARWFDSESPGLLGASLNYLRAHSMLGE